MIWKNRYTVAAIPKRKQTIQARTSSLLYAAANHELWAIVHQDNPRKNHPIAKTGRFCSEYIREPRIIVWQPINAEEMESNDQKTTLR